MPRRLFVYFFVITSLFLRTPTAFSDSPIQVHGDAVEYFHEEQKVIGTGHVSVDYEGTKLTADKITVFTATQAAVAEGHVTLTQKGSVFTGERAEYNFKTKVGNVAGMSATMAPSYYGKAKSVERVSENHYRTVDSYITTCCGDSPFYKIQAHQVDFYPDEKVVVQNALLYVQGVPVLFIPYYVQYFIDFDRFPVQIIPGKNSRWGAFVLTKWRYHLVETPAFSLKGNALLDYRAKRGFGEGVENFYRGDKLGHGSFKFYTTDDRKPSSEVDSDRQRIQWRHQSKIGPDTTFTAELNSLSDEKVIKDFFFREEYEKDAFPDNYVSIITAKPEYTLSFLERQRLNDFFTVVERSPQARFDTHTQPFADTPQSFDGAVPPHGGTPFYLRQELQFDNLKKEFANIPEGFDAVRLDVNHTLLYAGRVGGVSVTPRVGARETFYSREAAGDKNRLREVLDPGVDASTKFYKIYDIYVKALGLDYNRIRHVFTPTVSYNFRPAPTVPRTALGQFDALDAIDKQNGVHFNFENKLQTKEHAGNGTLVSRDIARAILSLDADLLRHPRRLASVGMDVELRPYSWMGIEGDANYNPVKRRVDRANLDFFIEKGNIYLAVGQRYLERESNQMTGEIRWKINSEWSVKVYDRYEFVKGVTKEFEFTVSKVFDCVIADVTYNHRNDGDTFFVVLRLKAFPKASFGLSQSYEHPKASPRFKGLS